MSNIFSLLARECTGEQGMRQTQRGCRDPKEDHNVVSCFTYTLVFAIGLILV